MNKIKKVILIIVSILCVWLFIGIIDFSLVHNYHKPLFCIGVNLADDGGSGKYVGLGYSFEIEGNFVSESEEPKVTSYKGYLFGKKITRGYWERMLTEDDKNKLIYGDNDVLNFVDNEIVINQESGEKLDIVYKEMYSYVIENESILENIALKYLNNEKIDFPSEISSIDVFAGENTIVEFSVRNITKQYSGFYYSIDDVPTAYQSAPIELFEIENEVWEWKAEGDNKGKTIKIKDNWYYYEASL